MAQQKLLQHLQSSGVLRTPRLIKAISDVDRANFVPPEYQDMAYDDHALPIGYGQTISQPTTVAFMLELLQPQSGDRILDLGSGSGWTTALLASTVGKQGQVFGVELVPELVAMGRQNFQRYQLPQASITAANPDVIGLPEHAPFDKILVSAEGQYLPQELITQLKTTGILVIPIKGSVYQITKLPSEKIQTREFPGFVFVPLR